MVAGKFFRYLISCFIVFWGCAESESLNYSEVHCFLKAEPVSLLNGRLLLDAGHLNLSRIEASATRFDGQNIAVSHSFSGNSGDFLFIGTDPLQPVQLRFQAAIYQNITLDFYPVRDEYKLILKDTVLSEPDPTPSPGGDNGGNQDDNGGEDDGENGDNDDHEGDEDDDEGDDDDDDDEDGDDDGEEDDGEEDDGDEEEEDEEDEEDEDDGDSDDEDEDEDDEGSDNDDGGDEDNDNDEGGRTGSITAKTVDLAHFLAHAKPGIVLTGNYRSPSAAFTVMVAMGQLNKLVVSSSQIGKDSVVLSNNDLLEATAVFDLRKWFQNITADELEKALIILYKGQQILFIHPEFNEALHSKISAMVQSSITLTTGTTSRL